MKREYKIVNMKPGPCNFQVNSARLRANFLRLLDIDSPSGSERLVADELHAILAEQGIKTEEDQSAKLTGCNAGNVIVGGSGPARLCFCAHMDTIRIDGPHQVFESNGQFQAAGGNALGIDDKSGLAILIEAILSLNELQELQPDIHFIFTTSEEDRFLGAKYLDGRHFLNALAYVVDSGGLPIGYTVTQGVWQFSFSSKVRCPINHTGSRGQSGNAILKTAQWLASVPVESVSDKTYINVSSVSCPGNPNTIPGTCQVSGQILSDSPDEAKEFLAIMEHKLVECAQIGSAEANLTWIVDCEGFHVPDDSPAIQRAKRAAQSAGLSFRTGKTGAGSDAHLLNQRGGQAIKLSTGMLHVHSGQESIALESMVDCVKYIVQIACLKDEIQN